MRRYGVTGCCMFQRERHFVPLLAALLSDNDLPKTGHALLVGSSTRELRCGSCLLQTPKRCASDVLA